VGCDAVKNYDGDWTEWGKAMPGLRAELFQRRQADLAGWRVGIASYKVGHRFICEIDNVDPGARLARAEGATREAAEQAAMATAQRRLARTRVHALDRGDAA
jgi:hypothetical protein